MILLNLFNGSNAVSTSISTFILLLLYCFVATSADDTLKSSEISTNSSSNRFSVQNLTFTPATIEHLDVGVAQSVIGSFYAVNISDDSSIQTVWVRIGNKNPDNVKLTPGPSVENSSNSVDIVNLDNSTLIDMILTQETRNLSMFQFSFNVTGVFVGRGVLNVSVAPVKEFGQPEGPNSAMPREAVIFPNAFRIAVWRANSEYSLIFTIGVSLMQMLTTFMMGTQVEWSVILAVLKKPIAPAIGFFCQFLLMPLIALAWAKVLLPGEPLLQLGYFAVGCCPGGKASNFWSILLDANLDLSVTLTAISNLAALVMMPLWLLTIGSQVLVKDINIVLPFGNLVGSLALLIFPTVAGMLVRRKRPAWADRCGRLLKPVTLVMVVVIIVLANLINFYIYSLFTLAKVAAGMVLPWTGFGVSALFAWLARRDARDIKTIAIETGIQNASVAIVIIAFSLGHPDSDLTLVMPVVCLIFTPLPLLGGLIYLTVKKCLKKKEEEPPTANGVEIPDKSAQNSRNGDAPSASSRTSAFSRNKVAPVEDNPSRMSEVS